MSDCGDDGLQGSDQGDFTSNPLATGSDDTTLALAAAGGGGAAAAANDLLTVGRDAPAAKQTTEGAAGGGDPATSPVGGGGGATAWPAAPLGWFEGGVWARLDEEADRVGRARGG